MGGKWYLEMLLPEPPAAHPLGRGPNQNSDWGALPNHWAESDVIGTRIVLMGGWEGENRVFRSLFISAKQLPLVRGTCSRARGFVNTARVVGPQALFS